MPRMAACIYGSAHLSSPHEFRRSNRAISQSGLTGLRTFLMCDNMIIKHSGVRNEAYPDAFCIEQRENFAAISAGIR